MKIKEFNLHVEDLGNPEGEVVVFLNGVMASTNSWYKIMNPFINSGYRVILHDFKGQLKSDKPEGPYTFKEHAEETISILNQLGIKQAHFIGTSYGGEVGLNIAFRHASYVTSLAVIDSTSETDEQMILEIQNWIQLCQQKDGFKFFWGIAKSIYGPTFIKDNKDFLIQRSIATKSVDPSYLEGQIILYETFINDVNMTNQLSKIQTPTLIIVGEDDLLKPVKFSKIIHEEILNSQLVIIPDCGHVAIFEKAEDISKLVFDFVTQHKNR